MHGTRGTLGTPSARGLKHSTVAEVHGVVNVFELLTLPSPVKEEGTYTTSLCYTVRTAFIQLRIRMYVCNVCTASIYVVMYVLYIHNKVSIQCWKDVSPTNGWLPVVSMQPDRVTGCLQ